MRRDTFVLQSVPIRGKSSRFLQEKREEGTGTSKSSHTGLDVASSRRTAAARLGSRRGRTAACSSTASGSSSGGWCWCRLDDRGESAADEDCLGLVANDNSVETGGQAGIDGCDDWLGGNDGWLCWDVCLDGRLRGHSSDDSKGVCLGKVAGKSVLVRCAARGAGAALGGGDSREDQREDSEGLHYVVFVVVLVGGTRRRMDCV